MTETLAGFFKTNQIILYSTYGQVFFIMGLAIALQSRKHSQLALAGSLWNLSAFGFAHSFHEWGYVFIPIQAEYVPGQIIEFLQWTQLFLLAFSFLFLLNFGLDMVMSAPQQQQKRWLISFALSFAWLAVLLWLILFTNYSQDDIIASGNVAARYILGIPGSLLAAGGLRKQAGLVAEQGLSRIARFFRYAAWPLQVYAVFGGLIGPKSPLLLSRWLNESLMIQAVGIPAPIFRSLTGMALAYFIIRALEVFDLETEQLIDEIQRARLLADDRERIGRELHDGTIQSIYAAGLMLEDANLTITENPQKAQERINYVMDNLNEAIHDIRRYIFDLRDQLSDKPLTEQLEELVQDYRMAVPFEIALTVQGHTPNPLSPLFIQHTLRIVGEALRNIHKHAQATKASVSLTYNKDDLTLLIRDNGIGFDKRPAHIGQGLLNMRERVQLLGGHILIDGRVNEGVHLELTVPYQREYGGQW
ncbi:MAG: sensor histidine kinase [Chloroflexi bacterium]|nr:sensor histidine kinase [Chloroflexota bacterium]